MKNLHKSWKGILIRGVVAVIFGLIALFYPGLGFEILVLFFGTFALIDGIMALFVGVNSRSKLVVFEGVVGILVGLYVFFFTLQATINFILMIGVWAIITGVLEIIAGIEIRRHILNEIWLLFVGIISMLFGLFVFINPVISALSLTFAIGLYAIVYGLFLIALGMNIKTIKILSNKSSRKKRGR